VVLNRGLGNYPLPNHIGTFERRPEICKYNSYISNYLAKPGQIEKFDASNSSSITYEDLVGNSHTNIGPVFGEIASPTSAPRVVGDSVFWASRQAYLELLQSFLSKKIDGETLTSKFFQLRIQDMISTDKLCAIIEDQILPIPDLYYTFKAKDFSSAIDELYLEIDRYDANINDWDWNDIVYSESKLRSVIQEEFVPRLQHSCDLDDSFFRPQVDLDQLIRRSYLIFSARIHLNSVNILESLSRIL